MAKIHEELIVIKFSKLVKNSTNADNLILSEEIITSLEQVAQELVESDIIVEIVKDDN